MIYNLIFIFICNTRMENDKVLAGGEPPISDFIFQIDIQISSIYKTYTAERRQVTTGCSGVGVTRWLSTPMFPCDHYYRSWLFLHIDRPDLTFYKTSKLIPMLKEQPEVKRIISPDPGKSRQPLPLLCKEPGNVVSLGYTSGMLSTPPHHCHWLQPLQLVCTRISGFSIVSWLLRL